MRQNDKMFFSVGASLVALVAAWHLALRRSRRIDLLGKVVLITGGSRGLGLVLARECAERGARVAICARNHSELDRVRDEFSNSGIPLFAKACDIRVREQVGHLIESVTDTLGPIDILLNNAGVMTVGPAENHEMEAFEDVMRTNFWGPYHAISKVLPEMKARRFGRIVNITSIGGKVAFPHLLPYTTSKFALVGYSEGLRSELTKYNVFVTTVCPGLMRTGSPRNAEFTGQPEKEYAWFLISDSLPVLSISAKSAARKIVDACIDGVAEIHLGVSAKLGAIVQSCAPGTTAEIMSLVNSFLPEPGHPTRLKGSESESQITESNPAVRLTRNAEVANNQL